MKLPIESLRSILIFSKMSEKTLLEINKKIRKRTYSSGTIILHEKESCTNVYFILEGEVSIYRTSIEGKEQILTRLGKGSSFNTAPPLHISGVNQASVRTITNSIFFILSKIDYIDLLQSFPDFSYAILLNFADHLVYLTNLVENLSLHSVRGRLAHFLLEQADHDAITRRWTQDEIAEYLGTARDVVGRILRSFTDEGIIRRERNQIILMDRQKLDIESNF
jgi:CRP/FNR family transcriptional regulator